MKKLVKITSFLLIVCLLAVVFVACGEDDSNGPVDTPSTHVDYVSELKLDMNSESLKLQVTVKNYVDGDTVHFNVPSNVSANGVLKGRFLAIDTPESTGKIEDYGRKASAFTKEKLKSASSIIIESDTSKWNVDSTGDRYLVWVWYKPQGASDYRNLNVEILQNGLAIASKTANNRYGEIAMAALTQARAEKLYVHSGVKDPDMYYGEAIAVSMKDLRSSIDEYNNLKVAVEGVVVENYNSTAYVESFDEETGVYYGISVYYGFNLSGTGLSILSIGNKVRIVGTVQYYETGGTWQISGVQYREFVPDDPNNLQLISSGHTPAYTLVSADAFANGKVSFEHEEGDEIITKTYDLAELMLSASISMENLKIISIYTTNNGGSSDGAMTFTCKASDGTIVDVRTDPLYKSDKTPYTEADFKGKTISVKGIVDYFSGDYQIKVFAPEDITIVG